MKCEKKWFSENPFEFERDVNGNLFVLIDEGNYIIKQQLPDNSPTKFLLRRLKKEGVI